MSDLKVISFPAGNVQDIPAGLRNLADLIESGAMEGGINGLTDCTRFAWVATNGQAVEIGMLGGAFDRFALAGLLAAGMGKSTD